MSEQPTTTGQKQISFSLWEDMITACRERNLDPQAILRPEAHKGDVESTKRKFVLAQLLTRRWSNEAIKTLCPVDRVTLWRASRSMKQVAS